MKHKIKKPVVVRNMIHLHEKFCEAVSSMTAILLKHARCIINCSTKLFIIKYTREKLSKKLLK